MDIWDRIIGHTLKEEHKTDYEQQPVAKKEKYNISIAVYISREGTYILTDSLDVKIIKKIKNYFTIRDKTIMGYFKVTTNYTHKKNKLFIPRFGSLLLKNKFSNINYINLIEAKNPLPHIKYVGQFEGNQELIYNYILANIFNEAKRSLGTSGLILNLHAGHGKSFLAMALIGYLKCRTLIVTHNCGVLQQWVKNIGKMFPLVKIGLYYGKKKVYGDIIIGVINSLTVSEFKFKEFTKTAREFYDTIDLVIFDEAHEYCSDTRNKIYDVCQSPYMLGLSATPDERDDNLDKINHWGIGPVLDASKLNGYTEKTIAFKGKVLQIKYSGSDQYTKNILNEKLELVSFPKMVEQLAEDPHRIKMIIDLAIEHRNKGLNIFIFADRRNYLELIRLELNKGSIANFIVTDDNEAKELESKHIAKHIAKRIDTIRLVGGSSTEDMELAKEKKNIILSTYQYMGSAISIPKMNCLILATPRRSKSRQIIGRIFRLGSNYDIERIIIDIVDVKTSLKNQWYKRKAYYEEKKYPIEEKKISYKDYINYLKI